MATTLLIVLPTLGAAFLIMARPCDCTYEVTVATQQFSIVPTEPVTWDLPGLVPSRKIVLPAGQPAQLSYVPGGSLRIAYHETILRDGGHGPALGRTRSITVPREVLRRGWSDGLQLTFPLKGAMSTVAFPRATDGLPVDIVRSGTIVILAKSLAGRPYQLSQHALSMGDGISMEKPRGDMVGLAYVGGDGPLTITYRGRAEGVRISRAVIGENRVFATQLDYLRAQPEGLILLAILYVLVKLTGIEAVVVPWIQARIVRFLWQHPREGR